MARRRTDLSLLVVSAVIVVAGGLSIAAGLLYVTSGADSPDCALLPAGSLDDITERLEEGGPYQQGRGDGCSYLLALEDGEVVAYRIEAPDRDCSVYWQGSEDRFTCGDAPIAVEDIEQYPTWRVTQADFETLLVDLTATDPCDAYVLGPADVISTRLDADGPALVDVAACDARFWLALDRTGAVSAPLAENADCTLTRTDAGALRCGDRAADATELPELPVRTDGDTLVVDLTDPT